MLYATLILMGCFAVSFEDGRVDEVVRVIIEMPAWPTTSLNPSDNAKAETQEKVEKLVATARKLSQYTNAEILEAYNIIHKGAAVREYPLRVRKNLLLLNRILFDLPDQVEVGSNLHKVISGTLRNGPTFKTNDGITIINSTWPWILEDDGSIRFDTSPRLLFFQGYYDGPSCFKSLANQFQRRKFTIMDPPPLNPTEKVER